MEMGMEIDWDGMVGMLMIMYTRTIFSPKSSFIIFLEKMARRVEDKVDTKAEIKARALNSADCRQVRTMPPITGIRVA